MANTTTKFEKEIRSGRIVSGMTFPQKVWAVTARIPRGKVVTYADVAKSLRSTAYRAVGQALHRNPFAPGVPCHRVVGSGGKLTGFALGLEKKRLMLEGEGIIFQGSRVDMKRCSTRVS